LPTAETWPPEKLSIRRSDGHLVGLRVDGARVSTLLMPGSGIPSPPDAFESKRFDLADPNSLDQLADYIG
jgi:hypothetical protein